MAIRDLLWACPICGREGGLGRASRAVATCEGCGTGFRRTRGASIEALQSGRPPTIRTAAEWVKRLPPIDVCHFERDGEVHASRAQARFTEVEQTIRLRGIYLNRIEKFGARVPGRLVLRSDRLVFEPGSGAGPREWKADSITALQAASSDLLIKPAREQLVSFHFPDGSPRYWEELVSEWLRCHHRAAGRGEIVEFQPRIVFR